MLASIWATVSALYFIDRVCNSASHLLRVIYRQSKLPSFAKSVAELRNAKDHPAKQIERYSQKKSLSPLNGLVRWTYDPRLEGQEFVLNTQIFTVDPMMKAFIINTLEGIDRIRKPFDHLTLFAFDDFLHVSKAYEAIEEFMASLLEHLQISIANAERDGAIEKASPTEAEQRPFCVVGTARIKKSDV